MTRGAWWHYEGEVLVLRCQVQPRASEDRIVGEHGGRLRVRIRAVPSDGEANVRLRHFLAQAFGVAAGAVEISSGHGARLKTVRIRAPARIPAEMGCETTHA